jgi:DNA-binding transcriptional regulator YdaS (Cro superfamily)
MSSLRENIDAAALVLGSKAELARALGVKPQAVSDWRAGREACPIDAQAAIAALANRSAVEAATDEVLRRAAKKPYRALLERVLGKSLVGVAAILLTFGASGSRDAGAQSPTMYRPVKRRPHRQKEHVTIARQPRRANLGF